MYNSDAIVFVFWLVSEWVKSHGLSYLAVPKFIASGSHEHAGTKFRFMVMERFGEDIEKKFCSAGRRFSLSTVCYLALKLVSKKKIDIANNNDQLTIRVPPYTLFHSLMHLSFSMSQSMFMLM